MRWKQLEHITLTTGHRRMSPKTETDPSVRALVWQALDSAGEAPADVGAEWSVVRIGPSDADIGGAVYELAHRGRDVAACWLCWNPASSDMLWSLASHASHASPTAEPPTSVPWLAVRLFTNISVMLDPAMSEIMMEAGDLERIVAWALIERQASA